MMENFTTWERVCSKEAVKLSLEAVREWLPTGQKIRKPGTNDTVALTDELRADLAEKINSALETLSSLNQDTFDIKDMFAAGHTEVLFNCLEFYGEYIHSMLTFIGKMYRYSFTSHFGMEPEEYFKQNQPVTETEETPA